MPDPTLSTRALCDLDDVKRLVPGYTFDEPTDYALIDLINAQSDDVHRDTGREIAAIDPAANPRTFDLGAGELRRRRVKIGDCATITTVELVQTDGTLLDTIAAGSYVTLPRVRQPWEPIRRLWFPGTGVTTMVSLDTGEAIRVTGSWGFPAVPDGIKVAVAKLVLVSYIADVTARGSELADQLADINIARFLNDAQNSIKAISDPVFA